MARRRTILDGYTDEPAGLGVPPFFGTWPRRVAGRCRDLPGYLRIDDLRLCAAKKPFKPTRLDPPTGKTRIEWLNHTRSPDQTRRILEKTDQLIVIVGVQTPGSYLSAVPGTLAEVKRLLATIRFKGSVILTGPAAAAGTQRRGGAQAEIAEAADFTDIRTLEFDNYADIQDEWIQGAELLKAVPGHLIVEIETGRGCPRRPGCSFCTEPIKNPLQWRPPGYIAEEVRRLNELGAEAFRLGKQSCIFSYYEGDLSALEQLLKPIAALRPNVLHIDNCNPAMVTEQRTELFVRYLTAGSAAAMGIESFDPQVQRQNNLNCDTDTATKAIGILNRIGAVRGSNGLHALLPGINLLLGLPGETPKTLDMNLDALKHILDAGLLVRRINIRQAVPYPGTPLYETHGPHLHIKHQSLYANWIETVRREIDLPMLKKVFPTGTVLTDLIAETHEGNVTFCRQLGSYPIIVGIRRRLPLGQKVTARITDHMLRSLTGEVLKTDD